MVRNIGYRVDVYRGGSKYSELRAVEGPRIDADSEAAIKMSMSGLFLYDPDVDYLNDVLCPVLILDGAENPLGRFNIVTREDSYTAQGTHQVQMECYDNCYILSSTRTEERLHLAAGANYITAITQLLAGAGLTLFMATPTTLTLTTDREDWEIGTDYLTIINQLLGEINYEEIWFNPTGYAMLQPIPSLTAAGVDHRYSADDRLSLIRTEANAETDVYSQPNVFIVVCSNPDLEAPMMATAENDNPLSDLSTFRRGRRIAQVYKVDNIASQDELQTYAQQLCDSSILRSEVVTVETAIMPGHGVHDIVALDHPLAGGIYRETSWSMRLGAGQTMTHTLERIIFV